MSKDISRRDFLKSVTAGSAGLAAAGILGTTAFAEEETEAQTEAASSESTERVVTELDIPEAEAPDVTDYECDVLVVGGGFAGLFAAMSAKEAGSNVLLVDKGRPGYSGLSAWASSHNFFDEGYGDSKEEFEYAMMYSNEFLANIDWVQVWEEESKSVYEKCVELGILTQYTKGEDAGYWVDGTVQNDKLVDYHLDNIQYDRRLAFTKALNNQEIDYVEHTMIMDIIEEDGRIAGAIGMHVPSGTLITFRAKAVILCTGSGSYKPAGFPTGEDTFDGEYMGYMHGLPVTGQEFEDFHMSASYAPGNVLACNSWQYVENVWLCAPGGSTKENAAAKASGAAKSVITPVFDSAYGITPVDKYELVTGNGRGASTSEDESDPRTGKYSSAVFKGDVFGAAPGMFTHFAGGIFCGIGDTEGKTSIEGLWVAGDGTNGCMATGGTKGAPSGWTSNFAGVQGKMAGAAAAAYAGGVSLAEIPDEEISSLSEEILAPLSVEKGYDPNWARDILTSIMGPYWITIAKNETSLSSALDQIVQFRTDIIPKLRATSGHDLRLCHEMKHKALVAELKLRASLERKESRGYHFRTDYPYRDDDYLCYITLQKGDDDSVEINKVDIKEDWKGDQTMSYEDRYGAYFRFPGETEAMDLPETEASSW
ncbi:MAG: FAD-binding protein [Lachnospiraceae bacterium]|nr:FAD-binding protein [Lachnospiraceae bacterium]